MRQALLVYESMFGNTEQIARAIAEGLATEMEVEVIDVRHAPATVPEETALLVLGGPTHAFGMSRASTRADAAKHGEGAGVGSETGLREWLAKLPAPVRGTRAAAFSTVSAEPRWVRRLGSAGRGLQARLARAGFRLDSRPHPFYVGGTTGPLLPGEVRRARAWGETLARLADPGRAAPGSRADRPRREPA